MFESTDRDVSSRYEPILPSKPRPTVVLLHSSASSARQWERLADRLRDRFYVHAVDLHGHGARTAWCGKGPFTLSDDAALAAPMLRVPGGAHIVGHSYGAAVALKLAALHPRQVRSVTAYEPVMFRWLLDEPVAQEVTALVESLREAIASNDPARAAQRFVDFWSGDSAWNSLPPVPQQSIAARMHTVLLHFDALIHEPLTPAELGRVRAPMLFITGARTVAPMQRIAQIVRRSLPHATHEVLPGLGHMGPLTNAAEVNARITAFLDAREPSNARFEPVRESA